MMVGKGIEDIDITMPRDAYNIGKDTPTFNAYLTIVVRDSEGKLVKVHRQRSHSPTANFIGLMLPLTYFNVTGNSYGLTNTGGSIQSYKPAISVGAVMYIISKRCCELSSFIYCYDSGRQWHSVKPIQRLQFGGANS